MEGGEDEAVVAGLQEKDPSETPFTGVHLSRRTAEHSGLGTFCRPTHQCEDESESRDSSRDSSVLQEGEPRRAQEREHRHAAGDTEHRSDYH